MRVFLSFHSRDKEAADRIRAALAAERPSWVLFYSPLSIVGGVFWMPQLGEAIAEANAFIFIVGQVPGPYQTLEYYAALDRKAKEVQLPLVPLLLDQSSPPGWPFFNQLNWLAGSDSVSPRTVAEVVRSLEGGEAEARAHELWRLVNPYRQLLSLREEDAAFFHGRDRLTYDVVERLAARTGKMTMLVGNSGVGKSSVAFAGVFAILHRQTWSGDSECNRPWPAALTNSRRWVRIAMKPGENPVTALASTFTSQWPDTKVSTEERIAALERAAVHWEQAFKEGAGIDALVRAADELSRERTGNVPERYVLYIDQGEELYSRAPAHLARLFVRLVAEAVRHDRVSVFGSLRADYFGRLLDDADLSSITDRLEVLPPDESQLTAVIERPAAMLGAAYEPGLVDDIIASVLHRQGALPLLSYWLHNRWRELQKRAAGNVIERPKGEIDIATALILRADDVLIAHPSEQTRNRLRRIFCVHLAFVPEQGEASRRVALRDEFDAEDWALITELAHESRRLVVTGEDEHGRVFAEVAHEALLESWPTLSGWIADRRDFYAWKSRVESDRKMWEEARMSPDALLSGAQLDRACGFIERYGADVPLSETKFVEASIAADNRRKQELQTLLQQSREQLQSALRRESLFLAEKAAQANAAGAHMKAMLIALEGLPDASRCIDRPVISPLSNQLYIALQKNRELAVLSGHNDRVSSADFSPDGTKVVTASWDQTARLWDAQSGKKLAVLTGHESMVDFAVFSPDGTKVVTASWDRTARLWDATSGKQLAVFRGHERVVERAVFSPDGRKVVTASEDQTARLWDAASGKELAVFRGHEDRVSSAVFSLDAMKVVTASEDQTARLWDAASGKELAVFKGHENRVSSAFFSPDVTKVVTASWDRTARVWDAASGKELAVLRGYPAVFSPDVTKVVTASGDGTARLWDAPSGKELAVLTGHNAQVSSADFSPDGTKVVTASRDGTARLWDAPSGKELAVLTGHESTVDFAVFSPDGTKVVTAARDQPPRLWDAASDKALAMLSGHTAPVSSADFSPDGTKVVTASWDQTARLWDVASGNELAVLAEHEDQVSSVVFSSDGTKVVTASWDRTARLWDAASGKELAMLRGHERVVERAVFSPDGRKVVTASEDQTARLWDAASGKELAVFRGHEDPVSSAGFSPDGTKVVTASWDRTARLWDAASGKELAVLSGHNARVLSADFNPDGTKVVTASWDGTARLWGAASGRDLAVLRGHQSAVELAVFNPIGTKVVTVSRDQTARLWDAASGKELAVLTGHESTVEFAVFSPDGTKVITASEDQTARLWDAASSKELAVLTGHKGAVDFAVFSPDGRKVITASDDQTARLWRVYSTIQDLVNATRATRARCLTPIEREELYLPPGPPSGSDSLCCLL